MKLTIIGGGGFRVPLVFKALLADQSEQKVTELRLYDTDGKRLQAISAVLAELSNNEVTAPKIIATQNLSEALVGTDFVFSAIRVGGTHGRAIDEKIALQHGVIGQETVGVGGISYALRGIPVVIDLANQIKRYAPQAWVINFTNPAGVMTEVMRRYLGDRVIGICDSPVGLARRVLGVLGDAGLIAKDVVLSGVYDQAITIEYAGLNHLGWLTGLKVSGEDLLPKLLDRPDLIESFEEGRLFGAELIQALGCIPNEYLHYYYYSRDYLNADQATEQTRGVFLEAQQSRFYDGLGGTESALTLWENTRLEREATYMATNRAAAGSFEREESDLQSGGYDKVALAIMHAIANDVPAELILNVANNGLIAGLADDAVVEVPCLVDGRGVRPLAQPSLPEHAQGMVINAKYVERCTIEAAVNQSRNAALLALLHHRLIDSFTVANDLLDDLVKNFPELSYLQENANV